MKKCAEFTEKVETIFDYLFNEHDFVLVFTREETKRSGYCLLGLQNAVCRIVIYKTWSEGNLWIGPLNAAFDWALEGFYSGGALLMFILKQDFQLPDFKEFHSTEIQLQNLSDLLKPNVEELLDLFKESKLDSWQKEYKTFMTHQEKKIVDLLDKKN